MSDLQKFLALMALIWSAIVSTVLIVSVYGDDTEDSNLKGCLLGIQHYCDQKEIENITNQFCHDHFNNGSMVCHKMNMTMPEQNVTNDDNESKYLIWTAYNKTDTIPFPIIKGGVTFCYELPKKVNGIKDYYKECNYVGMSKKKLLQLRDHLENWTAGKK
jgi:hypothetical protein